MLVVNPEEDSSVKFIAQLKRRLASPGQQMGKALPSMQVRRECCMEKEQVTQGKVGC